MIASFAFGAEKKVKPSNPPGRPKTRTHSHYEALRDEYSRLKNWFEEANGRPARSDAELLRAHLAAELQRQGLEPSLLESPDVQKRLKTLRNELSQAKKICQLPMNWLFSGRIAQ
jgi:hypothetical protein